MDFLDNSPSGNSELIEGRLTTTLLRTPYRVLRERLVPPADARELRHGRIRWEGVRVRSSGITRYSAGRFLPRCLWRSARS